MDAVRGGGVPAAALPSLIVENTWFTRFSGFAGVFDVFTRFACGSAHGS